MTTISSTAKASATAGDTDWQHTSLDRIARWLPLTGVAFAVTSMAGNLTIGPFPDERSSVSTLTTFYAAHHTNVALGGRLLGYATVLFALFGAALWWRLRRSQASPVLAATALVGTAMVAVGMELASDSYLTLGELGVEPAFTPSALQALHVGGSAGGSGADTLVFLLPIALAGILSGALPRWLSWPALLLAVLAVTPLGFFGYLFFHLWAVVAGITLALRPLPVRQRSAS